MMKDVDRWMDGWMCNGREQQASETLNAVVERHIALQPIN